jgi:hypothetical protein
MTIKRYEGQKDLALKVRVPASAGLLLVHDLLSFTNQQWVKDIKTLRSLQSVFALLSHPVGC